MIHKGAGSACSSLYYQKKVIPKISGSRSIFASATLSGLEKLYRILERKSLINRVLAKNSV